MVGAMKRIVASLLCLGAAAVAQDARYEGLLTPDEIQGFGQENLAELEDEVTRYLAADDEDAPLGRRIRGKRGLTPRILEAVVRAGRTWPAREPGVEVLEVHVPETRKDERYVLMTPDGYDPARAYPLLVYLHGTSGNLEHCQEMAAYFRQISRGRYLAVLPVADPRVGWGPNSKGAGHVFATLAAARRVAHVDPDRVYLTGQSMGGHATWYLSIFVPSPFAAIAPKSGCAIFDYCEGNFANLRPVPVYYIFGAQDQIVPLEYAHETRDKVEKAGGIEFEYKEYPDAGHEGAPWPEIEKSYDWLLTRTRPAYPGKVWFSTRDPLRLGTAWIEIDRLARGVKKRRANFLDLEKKPIETRERLLERVHIEAEVTGPAEITVDSSGVDRFVVYLHPSLVRLDGEVVIRCGRREVFGRRVQPSLDVLLESARRDPGRIFWQKVECRVP